MRSCEAKLCPRVFAKCLPQLWGWVSRGMVVLVAQAELLGRLGCSVGADVREKSDPPKKARIFPLTSWERPKSKT